MQKRFSSTENYSARPWLLNVRVTRGAGKASTAGPHPRVCFGSLELFLSQNGSGELEVESGRASCPES